MAKRNDVHYILTVSADLTFKNMFDISRYVDKLKAAKEWIFNKIDGKENFDLNKRYYDIDVLYEMDEINKKEVAETDSDLIITDHAFDRAKERLSMNRSAFKKQAELAWMGGISHYECAGNLKKYIDKLYLSYQRKANNIKIYGEVVFIFSSNILITTYQIPNNLKKSAFKNQKIKYNGKDNHIR